MALLFYNFYGSKNNAIYFSLFVPFNQYRILFRHLYLYAYFYKYMGCCVGGGQPGHAAEQPAEAGPGGAPEGDHQSQQRVSTLPLSFIYYL
jgi:hypothetical protein